jgi:hypothetical protein
LKKLAAQEPVATDESPAVRKISPVRLTARERSSSSARLDFFSHAPPATAPGPRQTALHTGESKLRHPNDDNSNLPRVARGQDSERHPYHYNPSQPRVPAGHRDGGQWTGGGPYQVLVKTAAHDSGRLIDAVLGHRDGDSRDATTQLAFSRDPRTPWTRPQPLRIEPPLPAAPPGGPIAPLLGSAILGFTLYSLWSQRNNVNQRAIIAFKGQEFRGRTSADGKLEVEAVQFLDAPDVQKICGRLKEVQKFTNDAFNKAKEEGGLLSRAQLGTKVHEAAKNWVAGREDSSFRPEVSFARIGNQLIDLEERKKNVDNGSADDTYGEEGSIRPDCYQRKDPKTVCIYDIKTGASGLSQKRMEEFARRAMYKYPCTERVIVTEIRPGDPVPEGDGK